MKLFSNLKPNTTLLTPNRRLSATLLQQYNQYKLSQNELSFATLDVLPYTSWIERLWKTYRITQIDQSIRLLTGNQEHILWEDILKKIPETQSLLQVSSLAEMAKSAYRILAQWQIPLDAEALKLAENNAFLPWAHIFEQTCFENNWLDTERVQSSILKLIQNQAIPLPEHLILLGFTEFSPLQNELFKQCELSGTHLSFIEHCQELPAHTRECVRIGFINSDTELLTMARFAHQQWQQHGAKIRIGCIIPNLDKIRDRVLRIFLEIFTENNEYTLDHTTLPFNISAGKSLTQYPIVDMAFEILNLYQQQITNTTLSRLLRSPFLGDAEHEQILRSNFDERLKVENIAEISLMELINDPKLKITQYCPRLARRFTALLNHRKNQKLQYAKCSEWVVFFMELLSAMGWPGERSLNSPEYQVAKRFLDVLYELRSFDAILGVLNYADALHYLIRLSQKTIYQPQTPDAPIQILGLLEAAPLPFDITWVMGLDDITWPPSIKPNPLIPLSLQKQFNMPHATADRELAYSKRLTEQLKQNSKNIIFSYPENNLDSELNPSSLIADLPERSFDDLNLNKSEAITHIIFASSQLEQLHDETAPPIVHNEPVHGGVSILKLQAACPFKAFAEMRLFAEKIEAPSLALRAKDRGVILHKALELIWKEIKSSNQLHQYQNDELKNIIQTAIAQSLKNHNQYEAWYLHLENIRLSKILQGWLAYEKLRPEFAVIFNEQVQSTTIGPMQINLRIDRIDQLANGDQLIIDYKTGRNKNSISAWFDDRLLEPQLPLYCLTESNKTIGIAYAEVHPNIVALRGVSQYSLDIATIQPIDQIKANAPPSWGHQLTRWRHSLEQSAADFYQGIAKVAPKNSHETCTHCHLQPLCRIQDK